MNRIAAKAIGLTVLFFLSTSLSALAPSIALDPVHDVRSSNTGTGGAVDVPTYRIGDEWVYETKFDIASLLAQANVSASLNALTGDTRNEVVDISYVTDSDGSTVLAYEIQISGSFTSASGNDRCGANLEGTSGRVDIAYQGLDIVRARDLGLITSNFFLVSISSPVSSASPKVG